MCNIEDKETFEESFNIMRIKVDKKKASSRDSIYKFKEIKMGWMLHGWYFHIGNEKHTTNWEFVYLF